jgi:nanoRNase/pAp phosphatase (c-di-AMP/oligoRNAs hydrolase)
VNQDLTPKQQTSEAIRQAETILIITGQHPNIDQASSTLALAAVLRKFGKKVTALISDSLPQQIGFLETGDLDRSLSGQRDFILKVDTKKAQVDKLRYEVVEDKLKIFVTPFKGSFAPSDVTYDYGSYHYDLVIVLGVPTRARIDRIYADNPSLFENLPIINLDFHRSHEQYGAINLIEPMAASLCEILVALAESLQNGIVDEQIATAMLTGLMASTDRFTASHTTAKSLTVAAQLMAAGAKQPAIVRALFRDGRSSDNRNDRPAQPQPQVQAPAPAPAPQAQPQPEPVGEPEPEMHGPIPVEPAEQPIIDPGHVELMPTETADFTAAAEILQQRQQD